MDPFRHCCAAFQDGLPQVEALGQKSLRMHYHSYSADEQQWVVGLATSKDGFKWAKQGPVFRGSGQPFDAKGVVSHHIVKDPEARR